MAIRDEIAAMYQSILGRPADEAGLNYFTNAVTSGAGTLADVRRDITASQEAQGLLAPKTPTTPVAPVTPGLMQPTTNVGMPRDAANSFVNSVYNNVLLRPGEQAGVDYWANLITSGAATPAEVEAGIRNSAEAQGVRAGVRQVGFGSQPVGGNVYQMAQYNAPQYQPPSIQNAFQQSLQYQAALPSLIPQFNPADIPATYQQVAVPRQRLDISNITVPQWLQDAAKKDQERTDKLVDAEVTEKTGQAPVAPVNTGISQTTVGAQPTTPVAAPSWVTDAYARYLGRTPEAAGANYWAQQAAAGVPIADLVATIASSSEAKGLLGK